MAHERRLLVVEGDEANAQAVSDQLRDAGFLVDIRCDGLAGFDATMDGNYDAILLDIMLPKRNGFSVRLDFGVDIATAHKYFEQFVREDSSRTRSSGGTSLGLTIVADITSRHGGSAAFVPTESGSTIHLRVRRYRVMFESEQKLFHVYATAVATETRRCDHAVTGHQQWPRIGVIGIAHRACRPWPTNRGGKIGVGNDLSVRNRLEGPPAVHLKCRGGGSDPRRRELTTF